MNKSALKSYAPQARRDFIDMVTSRAAQLGISEPKGSLLVEPCTIQGDVAIISGIAYPAMFARQRQSLIAAMQKHGYAQTLETIAYTWFNRLAALRYMELQDGFLRHGFRVLSSANPDSLPDILTHALELAESGDLPGITAADVADLKLASKDGELYKRLLVAQCNALSDAMPFLFERIEDETELLLPDNLLRTDSVIRKLVVSIDEADWQQVEIIGWLYQFYISEKKDLVIGKVVKSEDIPAATQLFTPNWIVKYLVQNSVGRLWLQANPDSTLAAEMVYYIQPAEQTPEVQAELDKLIQSRISEDGDTLNPESITVLDPACGSGHILVEAYDLLKAIYLERGYRTRDIPRRILEKNLHGLDIDDRAAQLASFALLMKARADDRRLFDTPPHLNVFALQESKGADDQTLAETVLQAAIQIEGGNVIPNGQLFGGSEMATRHSSGLQATDLRQLIQLFAQAKTVGSLLTVPTALASKLPSLAALIKQVQQDGNSLSKTYADEICQYYLLPTQLLTAHYDAVVANPPYMGSKGMNAEVKEFAKKNFPDSKSDMFAMFIERGFDWCKTSGFNSMVTMQSWMFLSSYQAMREKILANRTIVTMAHLGARAFSEISGEVVQTTAFILQRQNQAGFRPVFFRLTNGSEKKKEDALLLGQNRHDRIVQDNFKRIPGSPVAYWISPLMLDAFSGTKFGELANARRGLQPGDVPKHVRLWHEISSANIAWDASFDNVESISTKKRWFLFNSGGGFRRWFGNIIHVVNWHNNGYDIKNGHNPIIPNEHLYLKKCVTWSKVSGGTPSFRIQYSNTIPGDAGPFAITDDVTASLGLLNSKVTESALKIINPTLNYQVGDLTKVPAHLNISDEHDKCIKQCIKLSEDDWAQTESSFSFGSLALTKNPTHSYLLSSWESWHESTENNRKKLSELEIENNIFFIKSYGLQNELSPDVPEDQITLLRADREKDSQRLISYAIGCMMGRYSLDESGLIYAQTGNLSFDPSRYNLFPADDDGIVPVSDTDWFPDDATTRMGEFLAAVWGNDTLTENMAWLAESLGANADETPEESLRRYISGSFFKVHCSKKYYKNRPIYWLFSSGKQKAFEALVYLHRYNEGTLGRMRAEYVVPLTGKMAERIKLLEDDAPKASSAAARKKIDKEIDKLKKKLEELRHYDEKLRHYADLRITLDLDDGVKFNYGQFGDLLADVKSITGGAGDD